MYHSTRSSLQEAATLPLILGMLQNIDFTFVNGTFYTAVCIAVFFIVRINFSKGKNTKNTVLRTCECVAVKVENGRTFSFYIFDNFFFTENECGGLHR